MELTEREIAILRLCHTYAYVDGAYIKKYVFYPDKETLTRAQESYYYKRVKLLVDEGYLYQYSRVTHDYSDKKDMILCLSKKGIQYAKAEFSSHLRYRFNPAKHLVPSYNHYLAILRIVEKLKRDTEETGQEFFEFYTEAESYYQFGEEQKERIRPDGVFLIRYHTGNKKGLTLAFFLEVERFLHTVKEQKKRLEQYNQFFSSHSARQAYKDQLGGKIDGFALFFVGTENLSQNRLVDQLVQLKNELSTQTVYQQTFLLGKEADILGSETGDIYQNLSKDDLEKRTSIF